MAQYIKTDGTIETVVPANGKEFDWQTELYPRIGGYVEILEYRDGTKAMVLDEEGKLKGYDLNLVATQIAKENTYIGCNDYIVGNVLICSHEELGE